MASFLDRVGLVSVWEKFPVDFTYMHTDHKSTSILDNFYVNHGLLQYVVAAGPMHLGDNPSGHSPIMLSLNVGSIPKRPVDEEVRVPRRLAWDRAQEPELKAFTTQLSEQLQKLEEPQSMSCTDVPIRGTVMKGTNMFLTLCLPGLKQDTLTYLLSHRLGHKEREGRHYCLDGGKNVNHSARMQSSGTLSGSRQDGPQQGSCNA